MKSFEQLIFMIQTNLMLHFEVEVHRSKVDSYHDFIGTVLHWGQNCLATFT